MASNSTPHHSGCVAKFIQIQRDGILVMPPKDLNIIWAKDNRYWNIPDEEGLPAELHQVSWLEVTGFVDETNPDKNYEVGFHVSLTPNAFGWGKYPIYVMVKKGKEGKAAWTKISIDPNKKGEFEIIGKSEISEKQVEDPDARKIHFGLYEVWSGKWKGGLKIHSAFIRELP